MNRYIALAAGIAAIASLQTPAYASVARMSTPANHQLISTSRNDKWGVGYIGDGSTGDTSGFLWNLVTGKIDNVGTLSDAGGIAVDNNGVVYGCYSSNDVTGASRIAPGYYKDGNWHNLPIPEGFQRQLVPRKLHHRRRIHDRRMDEHRQPPQYNLDIRRIRIQ